MKFDLARYKELSGALDDSDIDYGAFAVDPLPPEALRCLRYMHDIEQHTVCYLRDILVTPAHADPDLTAFLAIWVYEELWHGEAIGKVLAAHGEVAGTERLVQQGIRDNLKERLAPLKAMVLGTLTRHLGAIHMTWGALNEWTTQAGYARLIQRADHPVLSELLRRIMKQEGRHIDFYASEAQRRLTDSPAAQRLTRWVLRHTWAPVGSGVMPDAEVEHLISYLFGDAAGGAAAARIDRRVDCLPGLEGLSLVSTARARFATAA